MLNFLLSVAASSISGCIVVYFTYWLSKRNVKKKK
ncbi:TPA: type I toxin-antitoxin system Fst family toxin [Staphylococcus delphini]|uniref:Type I toxin-antitoxin system Fst family toxin n=1 Tax=Staphylococcus delphini TaxID=53344 RepID=A0AAQ0D7F5_9STAP|nr:type I toxin-antitoxin system Fst family toxin [Staphylococcus delphini]MDE9798685.1 type I toxin-antitoxin system Fst family toxin [Staphylococcus delphini]MDE9806671.1 type I toxin-antitoxin system Fst family toxin [Staphylococcus delphini]MTV21502.1 type I toxin-antitoxin system Fst family toxin [Staphylococcus delphini]NBK48284.1 type I toxin-antitoxin system Fst family toxin [Staphylococcus delphini]QUM67141.1 type I toxin-antitoxin system Fst family toxin [Staphylococcus delphini]